LKRDMSIPYKYPAENVTIQLKGKYGEEKVKELLNFIHDVVSLSEHVSAEHLFFWHDIRDIIIQGEIQGAELVSELRAR